MITVPGDGSDSLLELLCLNWNDGYDNDHHGYHDDDDEVMMMMMMMTMMRMSNIIEAMMLKPLEKWHP